MPPRANLHTAKKVLTLAAGRVVNVTTPAHTIEAEFDGAKPFVAYFGLDGPYTVRLRAVRPHLKGPRWAANLT